MSNGPNTAKVFRTLDGNGLIQSKSAFRTMQKNMPSSTRGNNNKSVMSKDKNNYLMNTSYNTKSPHPIKQIKNQTQTMKIDQTKLFSSFDERGSHYHTSQQKKLDNSHISRNKAPDSSSNNNRIKINNLTLRMK